MKKISLDKLSNMIVQKRRELNITQSDLGNKVNISTRVIECIENKKFIPATAKLEDLLKVLDIEFDDIIDDVIEENVFSIVREEAKNEVERECIDKMISMMLCLRKHKNIRNALS